MVKTEEKCHLCQKLVSLNQAFWMETGQYHLCAKCHAKIKMRQAEASVNRQLELSFSTQVTIERQELIFLREHKVLSKRGYVYLALRSDFSEEKNKINILEFCTRWQITQYDLMNTLSILGNKGFIQLRGGNLELTVLGHSTILSGLQQSLVQDGKNSPSSPDN